jgi:hypothetical protein
MKQCLPLRSFRLQNFKAARDSGTVRFGPLTVFIGNNGSGKSCRGRTAGTDFFRADNACFSPRGTNQGGGAGRRARRSRDAFASCVSSASGAPAASAWDGPLAGGRAVFSKAWSRHGVRRLC